MINWQDYHAYRVFDEFIDRFVLDQKSYITKHDHELDLMAGIADIKKRFIDEYDASSGKTFAEKLAMQFNGASIDSKIIFANIEYLWAMPYCNITPEKKLQYVQRWFRQDEIYVGEWYFFGDPHTIANPGQWNNRNKHLEICSILRVIYQLINNGKLTNLASAKKKLEDFVYQAIYNPNSINIYCDIPRICASHNALLHLSNPNKYESIVSDADKEHIIEAFGSLIQDPASQDREEMVKTIKNELYDKYAISSDPMRKERWFFYREDVKPLWKKTTKKERNDVGIRIQIESEENARNLDDAEEIEGKKKSRTATSLSRSGKLAEQAKKRDNYTCQSCNFHYKNRIVQVHHLDPLSERKKPRKTKITDLITLCPNCHYLAHYLLDQDSKYKLHDILTVKLKTITKTAKPS